MSTDFLRALEAEAERDVESGSDFIDALNRESEQNVQPAAPAQPSFFEQALQAETEARASESAVDVLRDVTAAVPFTQELATITGRGVDALRRAAGENVKEPEFSTPELGGPAVGRGILNLFSAGAGVTAAGARAFGAEESFEKALEFEAAVQSFSQGAFPSQRMSFDDLLEKGTLSDFIVFTAENLGEQVPIVASIVLSGGGGALVGNLAARGLLTGTQATALTGRFVAGGALGGTFAGATALETGFTALEQAEATGDIFPGVALGAGAAKGSLELIVPLAISRRLGITPNLAGRLTTKVEQALDRAGLVGFALGAGVTEATTEALQEVIDVAARSFVDENFDALGPEAASRIREAAAVGLLGGVFFGGGAGAIGRLQGRTAPETFDIARPPSIEEIQAGIVQPGEQLEFFPGENLGIEQPGVEQLELERRANKQLELPLAGVLGERLTVDPRQLDLFDSSPIRTSQQGTQGALFDTVEARIPPGRVVVLARGEAIGLANTSVLHFQRQRDAFERQALQGARNTQTFEISTERGLLTRDKVSGDALALPIDGSVAAEFVGEERNRRQAMTMLGDAQSERLAGRMQQAQELTRAAFELGARLPVTEGSGFFIEAGNVPGGREVDPAQIGVFGRFFPGAIAQALEQGIPVGRDQSPELALSETSESFDLNVIDPDNITGVDLEGAMVEAMAAARQGNAERMRFAASAAGVTLSGTPAEQIATLRSLSRAAPGFAREARFVELFKEGRIRQTLTPLSKVFVKGDLPPGAIVERTALETAGRGGEAPRITFFAPARSGAVEEEFTALTDYKPAEHKPGTTVIVGAHENKATYAAIKRQYDRLLEVFGLESKIILHSARDKFANTDSRFNLDRKQNAAGLYYAEARSDGTHVIWVDTKDGRSFEQHAIVAMHEFGHFLATTSFADASVEVQEMVINAFDRSLRAAQVRGGREAVLTAFSPRRAQAMFDRAEFGESFNSLLERFEINDWYSFDEWFAEQVTRWFVTSRKAMTVSDRFFQQIARKILRAFRAFFKLIGRDRPVRQAAAAPEVQQWLDSVLEQRNNAPPMKQGARHRAVQESTAENAAMLDPVASPAGGQSPNFGAKNIANKLLTNLPPQERKRLLAALDRYTMFTKWGWNILQLANQNQHIAGLQRYVEFTDQWYNLKMRWIARADQRVKEWNALGKQQADALGRFIFEIAEMKYLKPGEAPRHPSPTEVAALIKKFGINSSTFDVYLKVVQDFNDVLTQLEATLVREAVRSLQADPAALQRELANIQQEMLALRSRPYFPFSRFGDWTIVVRSAKDGSVIFMQQFETRVARDLAMKKVKGQFPNDLIRADKMPEEVEIFRGLPVQMLRRLEQKLRLTQQQKVWLDALIFESAPAQSFRQRFQRRRGVPGFSYDAVRSYANYFFHGANHIARVEHEGDLERAIQTVEDEARNIGQAPDVDLTKRRQIIDFMRAHKNYILTPENDWAALRSVAFQYHLGFSVASAFVNFTQVPMVAWPYLSARFGSDVRAANEIRKATLDIHNIYRLKPGKVPSEELRAIELGIQQGFLDESQATELAGVSEGHVLQRTLPGNEALRLLRISAYWSAWMFQTSEKLNRRVVFRAAYRLAKKDPGNAYLSELRAQNQLQAQDLLRQGWAEEDISAFLAGKDAVRKTQFEYAKWARPSFMRGKKGVVFTFFMYTQNMLWFARHSPGRARYLLLLLATAGLLGLPGAEDLKSFIKFAARQLGGRFDPEEEARKFLVEAGVEKPDLLLHGISRYGFGAGAVADATGLPLPSIDLSGRLSLGRIVPGVEALGRGSLDFETQLGRGLTDVSGAAFSIPINMLKALSDGHPDLHKRWERAMPSALRNLSKAWRFMREGQERTRTGATVIEFDIHDPQEVAEIVAQAMGFVPTRLSQKWDRTIMQQEALQYWAIKRGQLLQYFDYVTLVQSDREGKADVMKAIKRFNAEVPVPSLKITGPDMLRSVKERERRRKMFERGIPGTRRDVPLVRNINRLFPEVEDQEPQLQEDEVPGR